LKTVGISTEIDIGTFGALFLSLSSLFDIEFIQCAPEPSKTGIDAWILQEGAQFVFLNNCDKPCYFLCHSRSASPSFLTDEICFASHNALDRAVRNRVMDADRTVLYRPLPELPKGAEVVARLGTLDIFAVASSNGITHFFSSLSLPNVDKDGDIFMQFTAIKYIELLLLWLFLCKLHEGEFRDGVSQFAAFMFDDPNIRKKNYGYLDYESMLESANKNNFHVSIATIPLDYSKGIAAKSFFNDYAHLFSLLIHGNNHVHQELYRSCGSEFARKTLRQSLSRIEYLEARSSISISRVMVPPHGRINNLFLRELSKLEFDAVCLPRGALRHLATPEKLGRVIGMMPSEVIEDVTLVPRFPIERPFRNNVIISALLKQPIIAAGHHDDLKSGIELIEEIAEYVNSFNDVHWENLTNISRSLFNLAIVGTTCVVDVFSNKITLSLPRGTDGILLVTPHWLNNKNDTYFCRDLFDSNSWHKYSFDEIIAVKPLSVLEIFSCNHYEFSETPGRLVDARSIVPFVRRVITEGRDRLAATLGL
jgi:hypothetical protein